VFFLCGDLLVLYLSFELTTLPIILFVALLGVSSRRVYALSVMIVYMLASSVLLAVLLFMYLDELQSSQHFYIAILKNTYCADQWVYVAFVLLFFAVKVPVFPFYV
jgi:NADH:ubiquinone oxidoreductase subunit 4 (subunit M)